MPIIPISKLFEIYGSVVKEVVTRLDVAELNGFVADNNGMINDPHILIVRSPNPDLDNKPLGINDTVVMLFSGEDNAFAFQQQLAELFHISYTPCLF